MARTLGISWLHGRFHAVALKGAEVAASWTSPELVQNDADFAPALAEAVRQTGFRGQRVSIVIDHRSLLFHVQETPPAKGRVLRQLIERLVAQNHFFEEPACWGSVALPALKGRQRFLLALLPASLLRLLDEACLAQKLQLRAVLPLAELLREQLKQLSLAAEEVVVLAADLGGSLQLLLGRGDGQILFSRSVLLPGAQSNERAAQEINRTLHYAQQQFGAVVNQLFVFGEQAYAGLKDVQIRQGLRIQPGTATHDPLSFAQRVVAASPKAPLNLFAAQRSHAQNSRRLVAAGLAAMLFLSAAIAIRVEWTVRARETRVLTAAHRLEADADVRAFTHARAQEAARLRAFSDLVGSTNEPPVAELFTRYIAAVLPESMRLNQVSISRETNGWEIHLEGFAREHSGNFLAAVERLEQELQTNAFHIRVTDSTHRRLFGGTSPAHAAQAIPGARSDEKAFFVKGVIQ